MERFREKMSTDSYRIWQFYGHLHVKRAVSSSRWQLDTYLGDRYVNPLQNSTKFCISTDFERLVLDDAGFGRLRIAQLPV